MPSYLDAKTQQEIYARLFDRVTALENSIPELEKAIKQGSPEIASNILIETHNLQHIIEAVLYAASTRIKNGRKV